MNPFRPFEPLDMTTKKWLDIEPVLFEITLLTPCQEHLTRNWKAGQSFSKDPFVHVVKYMGEYYLSDGHHRVMDALEKGKKFIIARVMEKTVNKQTMNYCFTKSYMF